MSLNYDPTWQVCPTGSVAENGADNVADSHTLTLSLSPSLPPHQVCPTGSVAENGADNVAGCQCAAGSYMRLHEGEVCTLNPTPYTLNYAA